jgi:hypothetical protein
MISWYYQTHGGKHEWFGFSRYIGNTYPAVGFTTPDIKKYILIFLYQKIFKYQLKKQIKP